MLSLDLARLMHRHGDDWAPMSPVADHNPDALDPERQLLRGARVFRCASCDEEILVEAPEAPR